MRCCSPLPGLLLAALLGCLLLSACGGSPAVVVNPVQIDHQWLSSMQDGRSAFDQGHYLLASRLFAQAVERGQQMDRADDISDAAFNLAATQIELGNYDTASHALHEAKGESRRSGEDQSEILLLEARTARLQGDDLRARDLTDQLLQQLPEAEQRLRSQVQLLGGLLACEAGDAARAEQNLVAVTALLGSESHATLFASQAELQGCIKLLHGQQMEAAAAFDRESSFLQQAHQYRQMVNALHQAGTAYAAAGKNQQAADRLFRAARSAFSQERLPQAQQLLANAETVARAAEDRLLLDDIARLRAEITNKFPQ